MYTNSKGATPPRNMLAKYFDSFLVAVIPFLTEI